MYSLTWVPSPNYWPGRQEHQVCVIVLHIMQGTLAGTDEWFQNPASQVSAHYGVGKDGSIHKYVLTQDSAWHSGVVDQPTALCVTKWFPGINPNFYTVGIEHEGYSRDPMPATQYNASLWLQMQIMREFPQIQADSDHIIAHHTINALHATCPGFDIGPFIQDLTKNRS